jgi:hypothetical protein
MAKPKARRVKRDDQRLLVRASSWSCPYSFAPHYDRKQPESFFEVFQLRGDGVVELPLKIARPLRRTIALTISEDPRLPELRRVEPKGVGVYWVEADSMHISAYVPPGRLAALGPWLLANKLPWIAIELSYPEGRIGRLISFSLDDAYHPEDWQ